MKIILITTLFFLCNGHVAQARKKNHKHHRPSKREIARVRAAYALRAIASQDSRLARILTIEDHRLEKTPYLVSSLSSSQPTIVQAALLALGRIGDPSGLPEIMRLLNARNGEIKKTAAFALGLIGGDLALKTITQNLQMQSEPDVVASLYRALGVAGNEKSQSIFENGLKENSPKLIQDAAARGLGQLWSKDGTDTWEAPESLLTRLVTLAGTKESVSLSASFALSRYRGKFPAPLLSALLRASPMLSGSSKLFVTRALARTNDASAVRYLENCLSKDTDPSIKFEAAKGLSDAEWNLDLSKAFRAGLTDSSSRVLVTTLESIGKHGTAASGLSESILALYHSSSSNWVRGTALKVLSGLQPVSGSQEVNAVLAIPSSPLYSYALSVLGKTPSPRNIQIMTDTLSSRETATITSALTALQEAPEPFFTPTLKAKLRVILQQADSAHVSLISELANRYHWKDFLSTLTSVYPLLREDQIEARVSVLDALGRIGDHTDKDMLSRAMNDPDKIVVEAAATALKTITGKDEIAHYHLPSNNRVSGDTPSLSLAMAATKTRVAVKTERGSFTLKMLPDAPLTALNFVSLVKKGFYNKLVFHRIVPDFVAQGGDPRGDGYGGPGYEIRDEFSPVSHERGIVGMASSGKDTAGSQFFINLIPNYNLDSKYTAFAEVTDGMDIVDKLEPGDRILSAKAL